MPAQIPPSEIQVRGLDTVDFGDVVAIDEKITGLYRPEVWETRCAYYLRRDPDAALVATSGKQLVGFMLGEVRSGEFGLEEPTGWIEVLGVDPDHQGKAIGRCLANAMLSHFRTRGACTVRTLVDESQGDIAGFFTSLGFEPATLRPFVKRL
jgi:ribosomal protein S18 acetylase RimI-like enzyme